MQTQTQSRELKELYNAWCDCHSKGYKKDIKHIYRVGEQPVQTLYRGKPVSRGVQSAALLVWLDSGLASFVEVCSTGTGMKTLTNVVTMKELSPNGGQLNYLISGGRVYASAKSWARALQVPDTMKVWFETGLIRTALLNKNVMDGELEMIYKGVLVYRWHIVAEQLRVFDRQWYQTQFKGRPKQEQRDIERFHDNYERLVHWGYDLQERALSQGISSSSMPGSPVTQETLLEIIRQVIAPRLGDHDKKLHEQDVVIAELREAVSALRDQNAFISVKQAIAEQGLDSSLMPLYPNSRENLSSLVGHFLKRRGVEQGPNIVARLDGKSLSTEMNTYRRGDIYAALNEFKDVKQLDLNIE